MNYSLGQFSDISKFIWKPVLVFLLVVLVLNWVWGIFNQGKLQLSLGQAPAVVTIGNTSYQVQAKSEISLSPGEYSVVIRKDGFLDYSASFQIKPRETTKLDIHLIRPPQKLAAPAKFPTLSLDGSAVYYLGGDDLLYRVPLAGGGPERISPTVLPSPINLTWNKDRTKLLISGPHQKTRLQKLNSPFYAAIDPDFVTLTWVLDISSGQVSKIAKTSSAVWSASGKEIFFVSDQGEVGVFQIDSKGAGRKKVATIDSENTLLSPSPDGRFLALYSTDSEAGRGGLDLVSLLNLSQERIVSGGYQGAGWSPDSRFLITNQIIEDRTVLKVITVADRVVKDLRFFGSAESAVWESGLQSFYTFNYLTKNVVKINLSNDRSDNLITIAQGTPSSFSLTGDGDRLIYTLEGSLYSLKFK